MKSEKQELKISSKVNQKRKKIATELEDIFTQMEQQRRTDNDHSSNSEQKQQMTKKQSSSQSNKNNINGYQYTPKTLRRVQKQGKYAALQTMSMDLLRKESLYNQSKQFAEKIGINQHKNYFITALRLSLLYHHKVCQKNQGLQKVIDQVFEYFQQSLKGCVQKKYQNKNLVNLSIKKNKNDINVFKKVFQSDLSDYNKVFELVKGLYDCKSNGEYSQTHIKNADKLAKIIMGVAKDGNRFSQSFDFNKKLVSGFLFCRQIMKSSINDSQKQQSLPDLSKIIQEESGKGIDSEPQPIISDIEQILTPTHKKTFQARQASQMAGEHTYQQMDQLQQIQQRIKTFNEKTNSFIWQICQIDIDMRSPLTPFPLNQC